MNYQQIREPLTVGRKRSFWDGGATQLGDSC